MIMENFGKLLTCFILLGISVTAELHDLDSGENDDLSDPWPDLFPNGEVCEVVNGTEIDSKLDSSIFDDCTVDIDVLTHLMDLITEAYKVITEDPGQMERQGTSWIHKNEEVNCTELRFLEFKRLVPEFSEACQAMIDDIEQLILNVTDKLKLLVSAIVIDPRDCLAIKEALNVRIRDLTASICNLRVEQNSTLELEKKKLTDRHGCYIGRLRDKDKYITNIKTTLDNERQSGIASKIKAGLFMNASMDVGKYHMNSAIPQIVAEAYAPEYLESILYFGMSMPNETLRMRVYNATSKLMREKTHYVTANIILFRKTLINEEFQEMPGLSNLLANITKYTKNKIGNWSSEIIAKDQAAITSIVEFGSPPWTNLAGWSFTEILADLITTTYSRNSGSVGELIKFGISLRWNMHKYVALTEMYKIFRNKEDKLQVALRIRDAMNDLSGPDLNESEVFKMFELFKNTQMAANIRFVVWHQKCFLRNSISGYKYLYSGDINYNQDFFDRPVSSSGSPNGDRTLWKIEAILENDEYLFRIKNMWNYEYFGSHSMWKENGGNGECSTNVAEPCYDWRHLSWEIHYENNDDEILLYHVGRKGYLFSDLIRISLVEDKRVDADRWKIECDG